MRAGVSKQLSPHLQALIQKTSDRLSPTNWSVKGRALQSALLSDCPRTNSCSVLNGTNWRYKILTLSLPTQKRLPMGLDLLMKIKANCSCRKGCLSDKDGQVRR